MDLEDIFQLVTNVIILVVIGSAFYVISDTYLVGTRFHDITNVLITILITCGVVILCIKHSDDDK